MTSNPLDLDAIKARVRAWEYHAGPPPLSRDCVLLTFKERDALVSEIERLRAALGSCGGFLVTLRDTCDYDFTLAHEEQIGRLCQEIFHALHPQEPSDE